MTAEAAPPVRHEFGRLPDGRPVGATRLENAHGMSVTILDRGGVVQALHVPDADGRTADVVLGFDDLDAYRRAHPYVGATIGRFANRIAGARFVLEGRPWVLPPNEGAHQLHGGPEGFDQRVFEAVPSSGEEAPSVELRLTSPDGDQGFPGALELRVTFRLLADALRIDYEATSDAATLVNPTHHAYFNLAGEGDVREHELWIDAEAFTPVDAELIPTGEVRPVEGTAFDFRQPRRVGDRLGAHELRATRGYDHNYVLRGEGLRAVARLRDPESGRRLVVETDRPGLQLFTANGFDGRLLGKGGRAYGRHAGLCLETQVWPDAPNQPGFPSAVLRPGETFRSTTIFRFPSD